MAKGKGLAKKLKRVKKYKNEAFVKPYTKMGMAAFLDTVQGTNYLSNLDYITKSELKYQVDLLW